MRRTSGLATLSMTALVVLGALAPGAAGSTRSATPRCKPKFTIVVDKQLGAAGSNSVGGFASVDETDAKHAYAVGGAEVFNSDGSATLTGLLDEGNGKHWKLDPDPGGVSLDTVDLTSVDSTGNRNVWVVGVKIDGTTNEPAASVVLTRNKAGWHNLVVPHLKHTYLSSVAVVANDDVYLGGTTRIGNQAGPVVLHYNGRKWSRTTFPNLAPSGVAALTVAGKTVVASMGQAFGTSGSKVKHALKYLKGTKWKTLGFAGGVTLSSMSGSSIHDLWATSVDDSDNPGTLVFHHTKQWTQRSLPDDEPSGVSERSTDPEEVWFAGASTASDGFGAIDVLRGSKRTAGSTEIAGDHYGFFGVDAHQGNRVLAVGDATADGTAHALIEKATC